MTLMGKDAWDLHRRLVEDGEEERSRQLREAREEATRTGKEAFDLEKLETMCDTSREGRLDPYEVRYARYEEMYYVRNPRLRTLAELAALVEELNRWS